MGKYNFFNFCAFLMWSFFDNQYYVNHQQVKKMTQLEIVTICKSILFL